MNCALFIRERRWQQKSFESLRQELQAVSKNRENRKRLVVIRNEIMKERGFQKCWNT